jgi:hypothetical protein
MVPTATALERVVVACRELIELRFHDGPGCGAAAVLLGDGSIITGTSPDFPPIPARPFVTRRNQILLRSVSTNPSWLRFCRQSDTGIVGPIVAALGTPALRCVDGNSQEVSQNRGWKVSGVLLQSSGDRKTCVK